MGKRISCAAILCSLLISVQAHGQVNNVKAGGVTNEGPNVYYAQDALNAKTATRVGYQSDETKGRAFIVPSQFGDRSSMACGPSNNSPAPQTIKVQAGNSVTLAWEGATPELQSYSKSPGFNPYVHATGPIVDYLASCDGDCTTYDATDANFVKVAEFGIDMSQTIEPELRNLMAAKPEVYHPSGAGLWAAAKMIQDHSSWTLNVPSSLKAGQYIWRSEMLNMHTANSAQSYIACIQLDVTGGGGASIQGGTKAYELYPTSAFSDFNIYTNDASTFKIPGPALYEFNGSAAPAKEEEQTEEAPAPAKEQKKEAEPAPAPEAEKEEAPAAKVETDVKAAKVVQPAEKKVKTEEAPLEYCTEEEEDALDQAEAAKVPEPASSTISVPARHRKTASASKKTAEEPKQTRKYEIVDHQDVSSAQAGAVLRTLPVVLATFVYWVL